jgi:hypothetical protein
MSIIFQGDHHVLLTPVVNSENGEVFAVMEFLREGLVKMLQKLFFSISYLFHFFEHGQLNNRETLYTGTDVCTLFHFVTQESNTSQIEIIMKIIIIENF